MNKPASKTEPKKTLPKGKGAELRDLHAAALGQPAKGKARGIVICVAVLEVDAASIGKDPGMADEILAQQFKEPANKLTFTTKDGITIVLQRLG